MFSLETERCILRPFKKEDAADLFKMDSDPLVHKYLGNNPLTHIDQALKVITEIQYQYTKYGMGRLAAIKKSTEEFLGWTGLKHEEHVRSYPYIDIGYRLKQSAWGKGIATEIAIACVEHGFIHLNKEKICAGADANNIGSNRVLLKLGMTKTEQFMFDGSMHNWYEMTNGKL
jgi:ribosomal-protein-alanine N-acetyltransferase